MTPSPVKRKSDSIPEEEVEREQSPLSPTGASKQQLGDNDRKLRTWLLYAQRPT